MKVSFGRERTARASGFAPFSIRDTQYESCWRSRWVFWTLLDWPVVLGLDGGGVWYQQCCDFVEDVDDFAGGAAARIGGG